MGIRFRCHHCEHELNLKEFQAGRRARCPACSGRFRVPTASADFSDPLDDQEVQLAAASSVSKQTSAGGGTFNLRPSSSDPDIGTGRPSVANSGQHASPTLQTPLPAAIREAPQAVWYVRPPGGEQYGPAEGHVFHNWLQDNRISPDSLVWRDGWPQWQSAGDVFDEHFGADWRVVQDTSIAGDALISEDTITSPTTDSDATQPTVANVAIIRRKKKQATYGIFIAILAILALVLIGVLISVIFK